MTRHPHGTIPPWISRWLLTKTPPTFWQTATQVIGGFLTGVVVALITLNAGRHNERERWKREDIAKWAGERREAYARFLGTVEQVRSLHRSVRAGDLNAAPKMVPRLEVLGQINNEIELVAPNMAATARGVWDALADESNNVSLELGGKLPEPTDQSPGEAMDAFLKAAQADLAKNH